MENKLFKKHFSLLMVLAMVLSMCPTFVFAEAAEPQSAEINLDPDGNGCPHCEGEIEWITFDKATHLDANRTFVAGGHYKLGAALTLKAGNSYQADGSTMDASVSTADMIVPEGMDVCFDLAGYTVSVTNTTTCTAKAVGRYSRAFTNEGTLSIVDSSAEQTGVIKNGIIGARGSSQAAQGGNVYNGGTLNLYGGTISGGYVYHRTYDAICALGGNIYNTADSVFNMYGGTVSGGRTHTASFNEAAKVVGGANIYSAGTVNISGGVITGGLTKAGYSRSTSTSKISTEGVARGGNLFIDSGATLHMTGGTVSDGTANATHSANNTATSGSTMNHSPARAYAYGGNIYAKEATVKITGGIISGGTVTASAKGESTSTSTYCSISYAYGGNVYLLNCVEKVVLSNVTISDGSAVATAQPYNSDGSNAGKGSSISSNGGNIQAEGTSIEITNTSITDGHSPVNGGNIYITGAGAVMDITDSTISGGIANYNVTGSGDGGNIYITTSATVNLYGTTKILNGDVGETSTSNGGNIYMTGSTNLNIYDRVEISGGDAPSGYGGNLVAMNSCIINMYGGEIKAAANDTDTVIYGTSEYSSDFYMYGGYVEKLLDNGSYNTVIIYNGETGKDPAALVAACTCTKDNGNGTYTVWQPNVDETGLCADCGHTYAQTVCSVCSLVHAPAHGEHTWGETTELVAPTCVDKGTGTHTCLVCEKTETVELAATGVHTFLAYASDGNATCKVDGTKTAKCEYCDETDKVTDVDSHLTVAHTYGPFENGKQVCSVCEHENACVNHVYDEVVTEPTCTAQGYTTYTCPNCGDSYKDNFTDPADHIFTQYESNGDATCSENGTKTAKCDTCGVAEKTIEDEDSKIPHNFGEYDENGVKTCVDCFATETCNHEGTVQLQNVVAATCQAAGYSGDYVCTECGVTTQTGSATELLPHAYGDDNKCVNGCNALAGAVVTYTDDTIVKYTTATDALVAANGSGATVLVLKTETVLSKNLFKTSSTALKNVTIATASGVTLKFNTNDDWSGANWYLNGVNFAAGSKIRMRGFPHFVGAASEIRGEVDMLMLQADAPITVYGNEGAKLRTERNTWITKELTVYGNGSENYVVELNYYNATNYNTAVQTGGVLNVNNARIAIGTIGVTAGSVILNDATLDIVKQASGSNSAFSYSGGSVVMNGESAINLLHAEANLYVASNKQLVMSADSTITTIAADLQNTRLVVAEGVDGCVYYADGVYTVAAHTGSELTCTDSSICSNCNVVLVEAEGHNMTKTEAKPDTCTEAGNSAYWTCGSCGKYYSDAEGTVEIEENAWIIDEITGHNYTYTPNGDNATHTIGCAYCDYHVTEDCIDDNEDDLCDICGQEFLGYVAINKETGESYTTVQSALNAATSGNTVKLLMDAVEEDLYIGAGKTLDLNGFTLTAETVAASFDTTCLVDSTNGQGLLVVDRESIALNKNNPQLPLWYDEGIRFVSVSFGQALNFKDKTGAANENVAYFRFAFNDKAINTILDEYLANGSAGTSVSIRIKASWSNTNSTMTQYFTFNSDLVSQYVNSGRGWDANMFKIYLSGVEGLANLCFTAEIVSTVNSQATVVLASTTLS